MIPGVLTQLEQSQLGAPPPALPTGGVRFSGLTGANAKCGIRLASLACTNNAFFGWSGWFRTNWYPTTGTSFPNIWVTDHAGSAFNNFHRNGSTQWEQDITNGTGSGSCNIGAADSLTFLPSSPPIVWHHIIAACDVNHANPGKIQKIYVDDVDATANISNTSAAWTFNLNGKDFWVGDDGFGNSWVGDVFDFSFWPGISLITSSDISSTTRGLFRDSTSGSPRNPSVAIAALGAPPIMLTGGAAGFLANSLGNSGALTVPAGYDPPTNTDGLSYI
jgi:hypothetical protein